MRTLPRSNPLCASAPLRFLLLIIALCAACGRSPRTTHNSAEGSRSDLRIVSLSPAISRTLVDLNLDDRIVGRTQFCSSIDQNIPVVGSLLDLDYERLLKLEPTHVLVQPSLTQGVEPRLRELAKEHGWTLGEFPALNTTDDIEELVLALPELLFADGTHERQDAAARAAELTTRMAEALKPAGDGAWKGSTLLVAGTEPVFVFAKQTYLDDVLTALGGTNAASHATGWVELSLEDVVRLNPEAIILVRERPLDASSEPRPLGSGERASATAVRTALGALVDLPIAAVENNRLTVLAHPDAMLPSTGVIGVAEALREVLEELGRAEATE